jgi:ABC-2 type transport system ATP-binding protein
VSQDAPPYGGLSVTRMLELAACLNRQFDLQLARARLAGLGIPPGRKVGRLSGGRQAQLARSGVVLRCFAPNARP